MRTKFKWATAMVVLVMAVAAGTAAATTAMTSSVNWPAGCVKLRCVNNHLNLLHAQVHSLTGQVAALRKRNRRLNSCLAEFPTTKRDMYDNYYFGTDTNNDGNFDQNNYSGQFTPGMLEQTQSGWGVDDWLVWDHCASNVYTRPPLP
jgi:hypothetical protein